MSDDLRALIGELIKRMDRHETNQERRHEQNTEKLDGIREDVGDMGTRVAVNAEHIAELRSWRAITVDPFIKNASDGVAQARGGLKGFKLAVILLGTGAGGGIIAKVAPAIMAAFR